MMLDEGTKIFVKHRRQDSDKPSVIFVHGDGQNHTLWENFKDFFFGKGHPVLSYDLAGHGLSEPYRDGKYSYPKFIQTLRDVLKNHDAKNPILVGNSTGGMIALQYATEYSDEITSVMAISSCDQNPTKYNPATPELAKMFIEASSKSFQEVKLFQFELPVKGKGEIHACALKYTSPDVIEAHLKALMGYDISSKLGSIKVPVLLVNGDQDIFITKECIENMMGGIPNSKVVNLEGYDHHVLLESPEKVLESIRSNYDFLLQK